ncbi:cytochrome-c peroxidase [Pelagibaculum spongiae]|uniref:Cytochrome-c peroxidase n=1 Tax=Pelagibaculum spongiae TaxID=2080658 RepID=A0A2V1H6S5_9GAMM|nr:cytochrome c peroxidase [Pelagibaculum spongiae]PVZ72475.1 cytochrome-c peroxidase [Pelagibaculum spongiae]
MNQYKTSLALLMATGLIACVQTADQVAPVAQNVQVPAATIAQAPAVEPVTITVAAESYSVPPLAALGPVPIPADNPQSPEKIELGKKLFFDGRLGGDTSTPCVACHLPSLGWDFPQDISLGYPGTIHWRNSTTVVNTGYYNKLFWDGSSRSLEAEAKSAGKGAVAGNGEDDIMEARLALIPEYVQGFNAAFGDTWPKINNAWRALAAFQRTLVQRDAPIDQYFLGDSNALSVAQLRGKELFEGKANCLACHNGAFATDQQYYNIGVPPVKRWEDDSLAQITFRYELYAKGSTEKMYRHTKADPGAYFTGKIKSMKGKFRTATLRYTKFTPPYMHNGSLATLADVVDFYDRGGVAADGRTTDFPESKSKLIQPLGLTEQEKADLLAFLDAFTGEKLDMAYPDLPPYEPLFTDQEVLEATK